MDKTDNRSILTEGVIRSGDEFDFEKILDVIFKRGWIIATVSLLALIISIFYFYKKPDIYKAVSRLIIVNVSRESLVSKPEVENIKSRQQWREDKAQLLILTGSEMLQELAGELKLKERFKVDSNKRAAEIVRSIIWVDYITGTNIIQIATICDDPALCRDISNGLADVFAKDYIRQRLYLSKEILKWFPNEAEQISSETIYGQMKALSDKNVIESLPSVVDNPVIKSLKGRRNEIKQELVRLSEFYKDKYPKVISLKNELNYIESQISRETQTIVQGIKSQLTGFLQINTVRIIEYADIPKNPIGPVRNQGIFLNTLLSFLITISSIVILDTINTKIRSEFDLKQYTKLSFLGYIPKINIPIDTKTFFTAINGAKNDILRDAFAYIRTSVSFSAPKEKSKSFLITSSVPSEGKTLLSVQLSLAFSMNNEKTLLIDGDLRRPSIHQSMNIKKEPGLTEYLVKDVNLDDIIHNSKREEHLFFVTSGHPSPNPSELLGSQRLKAFMKTAESRFDRIIIDSAPLLDIPDSFLLSNIVDGVILVIRSNRIDRRILMRTIEKLRQSKADITGVVINDFVHQKHGPYYYRYYRKKYYKSYYGSKGSSSKKAHSS